jgi:hypothetical protein
MMIDGCCIDGDQQDALRYYVHDVQYYSAKYRVGRLSVDLEVLQREERSTKCVMSFQSKNVNVL